MNITIKVTVTESRYKYNAPEGDAEVSFDVSNEVQAARIIDALGPVVQATAVTALENYRAAKQEDEAEAVKP